MNRNKNTIKESEQGRIYKKKQGTNRKQSGNRKSRPQQRGKGSATDVRDEIINNPKWYFINDELKRQAMQLSMQYIAGSGALIGSYQPETAMIIALNPAPGVTWDKTGEPDADPESGFNMACFKLYTRLSMKTGRSTSAYSPSDIGTLILAMGEIIAIEEHIRRYFGIAFTYNERNRTFPKKMLNRLGLNADDFFENFADYRMRFNTLITRINQIPIPMNIPYFDKCLELYQRVFLDSETPLAQVFAYVPSSTWLLDETSYDGGTILKTIPAVNNLDNQDLHMRAMSTWLSYLESMANALLESSTLNVIYADLMNLATYENTPFFKFDYLSEGYIVIPVYNREAMLQFQHVTFLGAPNVQETLTDENWTTPMNDVYPDAGKNRIKYDPVFSKNRGYGYDLLANFDVPNPTDDDKLEALRFTSVGSGSFVEINGTEYAHNMILPDHYATYTYIYKGNSNAWLNMNTYMASWMNYVSWEGNLHWLRALDAFDHHPIAYIVDADDRSKIIEVSADLDFVTAVPCTYLKRINKLIAMTLYDVQFKS